LNSLKAIPIRQIMLNSTVLVAALGYFVDIYDLVLFSIVRVDSLNSLGISGDALLTNGVHLLDMQMAGMLIGGLVWGILGDKRGRLSVLLGSILLYSLANLANAFVVNIEQYAALRLLAGIGLAGELGAAITLVSEALPRESRGYGTALVAGIGVSGAIFAALIAAYFSWRGAFVIGGLMGLALLLTRFKLRESAMFADVREKAVSRGDFFLIMKSWPRFVRYIRCVLIGVPLWFCVGILATFSPEICASLGATGPVSAGQSILYCYAGLSVGDILSGFLGQWWRSRKRIIAVFLALFLCGAGVFLSLRNCEPWIYYLMFFILGIAAGYWAVFNTVAAEQFGTNIRATVAISVPNFVRGSVVLLTLAFRALAPNLGLIGSAGVVGSVCVLTAFAALAGLRESFGDDLNFIEE
jgi:MFS transporter, putative metabolite:H+ symporter